MDNMLPVAETPTSVSFPFSIWEGSEIRSICVEMTAWIEFISVGTVDGLISVHRPNRKVNAGPVEQKTVLPDIGKNDSILRYVPAVIVVVLSLRVRMD